MNDSQCGCVTLSPWGTFSNAWDIFDCHDLGEEGFAAGILWVEVRDAATHPGVHGPALHNKNYLAPNVRSATVGKPWTRS